MMLGGRRICFSQSLRFAFEVYLLDYSEGAASCTEAEHVR